MPIEADTTLLVPLDFSESSLSAMSLGCVLAEQLRCRIVLLHVFGYSPPHRYAVPVDWMVRELRERLKRQLGLAEARLAREGVLAEALLAEGAEQPASEILSAASKVPSPMILLGTHSRTGVDRFLIGSTAEEVLRHFEGPVITVAPQVGPYWHRPVRNLLLATDLTERSLAPLRVLTSLWTEESRLLVLHVACPEAVITGDAWDRPIRQHLNRSFSETAVREKVRFKRVVCSSPSKAIHDAAVAHHTDMIAIGAHPAKAFTTHSKPRTAFEIITSAPCAVLSVCR